MPRRATAGASLDELLLMAIPLLRDAQGNCPRTGPGRKPEYEDWEIAAMIFCGVLKKKKTKSATYAFAISQADVLLPRLGHTRFPARSTFFERYKHCSTLVAEAIRLQGQLAIRQHVADAQTAAVDKTLMAARGPKWHASDRKRNRIPKGLRGVDREADWGYSEYHDWVQGYGLEVVVTAAQGTAAFPILASVDTASANERRTFVAKVPQLPRSTQHVLADRGYDGDDLADAVESAGRRRYLCPPQRGSVGTSVRRGARERRRQRRLKRQAFLRTPRGRRLYGRRKQTVEPFNATFKRMFELDEHVWHRGLDNNRTQILTAVFVYQLLVRHRHQCGGRDAQVQHLLDIL